MGMRGPAAGLEGHHTAFRCPKPMWAQLQILAKTRGLTVSQVLLRLVQHAIQNDVIPDVRFEDVAGSSVNETATGEIVGPLRKPRKTHLPSKEASVSK